MVTTNRTTHVSATTHTARAATMTLSEIMEGMNALSSSKAPTAEKLATYKALRQAASGLKLDPAFDIPFTKASLKALFNIGGGAARDAFILQLKNRFSHGNDVLRPVATQRLPFDGSTTVYSAANAQLSAQTAMLMYEKDARLKQAMTGQGFSNVQVMQGCDGSRASTAVRNDVVSVSFCGTADPCDLMRDAQVCLVDGKARFAGGKVHDGFNRQLDSVWPAIRKQIQEARAQDPNRPVLFSGHSLGGAIAVLALSRAKKEGLLDNPPYTGQGAPAQLHTFGQPRVGDAEFAKAFSQQLGNIPYERFVHRGDPVTQVPPTGLGYANVGAATTIFHDAMGKTHVGIAADDPRIPVFPQNLNASAAADMLGKLLNRVTDHYEVNYAIVAARLNHTTIES